MKAGQRGRGAAGRFARLAVLAVLMLTSSCSSTTKTSTGRTEREADSVIGQSSLPGAGGVKKAMDSLKDFDTWGLTPPFTYTSEDHRPTTRARLVVVKGGKIAQVREVSVDRDMKWIGK